MKSLEQAKEFRLVGGVLGLGKWTGFIKEISESHTEGIRDVAQCREGQSAVPGFKT